MHPVSQRGQVEPFHVMEVIKAAALRQATHGDVINLCVGQPSTPAPRPVLRAAREAIDAQVLGYTEALGVWPLRVAIADHYLHTYGVEVDPRQVAVTTGSSGAFTALFLAAFDVGDVVAVTRPGYAAYRNTLVALGCDVVEIDCGPATRYQPTVELLEALPRRPRGLVIASPANPTGTVLDPAELQAISKWCADNDCMLISDEIYHGVTYADDSGERTFGRTAWELSRDAAVVGSFSKYYSMTGWRLGWCLLPPDLLRPVELLLGNLNLCPPAVSQAAAIAAFDAESVAELETHVQRYADNRALLLHRLPDLGVHDFAPPDGAFYAWCDVRHLTHDSLGWCREVLDATGVAITPGVDFATSRPDADPELDGNHVVRISFCGNGSQLDEGIDRLVAHLGR